jgi:hypothetical protein
MPRDAPDLPTVDSSPPYDIERSFHIQQTRPLAPHEIPGTTLITAPTADHLIRLGGGDGPPCLELSRGLSLTGPTTANRIKGATAWKASFSAAVDGNSLDTACFAADDRLAAARTVHSAR